MNLFIRRLVWALFFLPLMLFCQVIWGSFNAVVVPIVGVVFWVAEGEFPWEDLKAYSEEMVFLPLWAVKDSWPMGAGE